MQQLTYNATSLLLIFSIYYIYYMAHAVLFSNFSQLFDLSFSISQGHDY